MSPVDKALWFIEGHLKHELSLGDIATSAGVSKHHLLRAFAAATGASVMRYVRGRRLSEAAGRLAAGASDILSVALEAGYNSHEAFTRAFGDQFGVTPAELRAVGHLRHVPLVSPITRQAAPPPIDDPTFETLDALFVVGLNRRYDGLEESAGVPAQWEAFGSEHARIKYRSGNTTYGVCFNLDDEGSMDYLCGAPVDAFAGQPPHLMCLRVPQQRYAVFVHREHMAAIRTTWDAIWNRWLPHSGHTAADAPLLERYEDPLHPRSGRGDVKLLVPLS
jgi:AraC family transcriptional regulator